MERGGFPPLKRGGLNGGFMGIDKPMVITEPVYTVATTHLLGLGLKLYPSNIPLMLNKDLTRFMQSFLSKQKKESKRKVRLCW